MNNSDHQKINSEAKHAGDQNGDEYARNGGSEDDRMSDEKDDSQDHEDQMEDSKDNGDPEMEDHEEEEDEDESEEDRSSRKRKASKSSLYKPKSGGVNQGKDKKANQ